MATANNEFFEALSALEKERGLPEDYLIDKIKAAIVIAVKKDYEVEDDNVVVDIDPELGAFRASLLRDIVEEVENPHTQVSLEDAQKIRKSYKVGQRMVTPLKTKEFGRIAAQIAKAIILQKLREEENRAVYERYKLMERDLVSGVISRHFERRGEDGKSTTVNVSVNLGKADGILSENEQVKGEEFEPTERIKVYILEVKDTPKGPRILVSRTHPGLVKRLFESEVAEVKDGTVEIKSIAREAGSRTKIAVWSNDPDVDAVGACVGMNGARVNAVVEELRGEKIDIINWDENPAILIENALSPAKVIAVMADPDEKTALVVVPDYQLSLAIGKEGQNARLAARLTGFKIDIKSETQAKEAGDFYDYDDDETAEDAAEASAEETSAEDSLTEETEAEEVSEEVPVEEEPQAQEAGENEDEE